MIANPFSGAGRQKKGSLFHLAKKSTDTIKSCTYSGAELSKKGVIVAIGDIAVKDYGQVQLTITYNQNCQFTINSTYFMVGMPEDATFSLEDLLAMKDSGIETVKLSQDITFNVNLLVKLLNKK